MTPGKSPSDPDPFWGWEDVGLFCGAVLPALAAALFCARLSARLAPFALAAGTGRQLCFQFWVYVFLLVSLYLLIAQRYGKPFWQSLAFDFPFRRAWWSIVIGPPLAVATSMLGVALRAPSVGSPVQDMITGRASLIAVVIFVSVLGPCVEELVFRGFLFPVVRQSAGAVVGILVTAAAFALLHGTQSQWTWQNLMLIGLAGVVFGVVRHKTGSTLAAAVVHGGYNFTFCAGFLFERSF